MRRATRGLWTLLLLVGVAAASAGQNPPTSADAQKLEAALELLRARNARDYAVSTPNGIDEARYVEVGGIQQWITIRGEDRNNPVLLFLHGGPGDATNLWSYSGFRLWLRYFTVVQSDQRGAGRTFGKNPDMPRQAITIARMTQDGVELADMLAQGTAQRQGHPRGPLVGIHPWRPHGEGAARSFLRVRRHRPGGGPGKELHGGLQRAIEEGGHAQGRTRHSRAARGWAAAISGRSWVRCATQVVESFRRRGRIHLFHGRLALAAPGYALRDVNDWFEGQSFSADRLVPETSALDARALAGDFAVPVFVFQGSEDFTTPTSLARSFVDSIRAPRKAFVPIEGGGHFAVFMKSSAFLDQLVSRVLPLAVR